MQENKEKAVALREKGYTYKQIVEALDSAVSLDWCKKTLKHIKKPKEDDECLKELLALGCRPEGVTHYEANGIIYKHRPNATKSNMDYIKEKAKKEKVKNTVASRQFVYLIKSETGLFKIGISTNPRSRLSSIISSSGMNAELIAF